MKSRIWNLAALIVLTCAPPLMAQTLEGQIVEDFQGTVTYTIDLGAPPAPTGMFLNFAMQIDTLQFTPGAVTFQGQPVDFAGTEAQFLATGFGGGGQLGGPPLPIPDPLRLGGIGGMQINGPVGNMQGDLRLAGMNFGPNLGPGFFPLLPNQPFVQTWTIIDWNSPVLPGLDGLIVGWFFEVTPQFIDANNGIVQGQFRGQIVLDLLPELRNIRVQQINWLDPDGDLLVADSNWGLLEFDLLPHPCLPFYLNIFGDIGNGPVLLAENFPLFPPLPPDPLHILPPPLGQGLDVDLGLLTPPEPQLSGMELHLQFITRPGAPPPEFLFDDPIPIPVEPLFREASGSKFPDAIPIGTDVGAPAGVNAKDTPRNLIRHQGVPGVQEEKDHCLAGSFARSISWLNTTYGLGVDKTVDQIYEDLKGVGVSSATSTYEEDVAAKATYLKTYHKNAQTKILDLSNAIGPVDGVKQTTGVDLVDWLRKEMKTEDVELHYDTHIVTVTTFWETGEGANKKTFIKYRDDKEQGDPAKGDTHERTAELTKNPDGSYSFRDKLQVLSFKVQAAVSESVPVELALNLAPDGQLIVDLSGDPAIFESVDLLSGLLGDLRLGNPFGCLQNDVPIPQLPIVLDPFLLGTESLFFLIQPSTHDGAASSNSLGFGQVGDRDLLLQCPVCEHNPFVVGPPLDPFCDANLPFQASAPGCVDSVCSVFPSCCDMIWDPFCVSSAKFFCGPSDE